MRRIVLEVRTDIVDKRKRIQAIIRTQTHTGSYFTCNGRTTFRASNGIILSSSSLYTPHVRSPYVHLRRPSLDINAIIDIPGGLFLRRLRTAIKEYNSVHKDPEIKENKYEVLT